MVRDLTGKNPNYFEAILQLRDVSKEIVGIAEEEIDRSGMQVVKLVELKNGWDYYLTDQNMTINIGRMLREKFGGEYQVTAKVHTRIKDREVYRLTILFRGLSFKKGDNVIYRGEEYKVIILGKDFILQNVLTGEKVHLKYKDMTQVKKKG